MAFKLIGLAILVAAASAGLVPLAPQAYHVAQSARLVYSHAAPVLTRTHEPEPYDSHPRYSYAYDVHDSLTGDVKSQQEARNGDVVEGSYSFIEADGSRRVVHYTADDVNGFNAVVENKPAQQVAVKTVVVAPIAYAAAAPVAHATYAAAAPIAHATYAALPVAQSYYH